MSAGEKPKRATRSDGVNTIEDLYGRCKRDEETGCLTLVAHKRKGSFYLWLPMLGKPVSLPTALECLLGVPLQPGQRWVPRCGNTGCCNPKHRFIGTRADLMRILRPSLEPLHRARIGAAHRRRGGVYSPELHAEIMASEESGVALAARLGIDHTHVCRIRRGQSWKIAAPGASVFHVGGGGV
jgi:hypothetical protein